MLDCFIQILQILEKCHRSDFYVGDLHTSNILISPDKKAYLFDFDQSIFIKNKIISGDKNETLSTLYQNPIINNVLKETYGVSEENFSFYNSYIQLLKPFFSEIDKEYIIREIIRLILFKLGICKDEYDITKRDITKLFLSKNLEKKLITCLIERIPLEYDDYLIFDLMDLKESKLIRKKLNW